MAEALSVEVAKVFDVSLTVVVPTSKVVVETVSGRVGRVTFSSDGT